LRNRARHGTPHDAPADDDNIGAIHGRQSTGGWRLEARGLKMRGGEKHTFRGVLLARFLV
jgi:hypothetical protein